MRQYTHAPIHTPISNRGVFLGIIKSSSSHVKKMPENNTTTRIQNTNPRSKQRQNLHCYCCCTLEIREYILEIREYIRNQGVDAAGCLSPAARPREYVHAPLMRYSCTHFISTCLEHVRLRFESVANMYNIHNTIRSSTQTVSFK